MRSRRFHRVVSVIVIICLITASVPAFAFANSAEVDADNGIVEQGSVFTDEQRQQALSELSEEDIIEEESGESFTTFDIGNGEKAKVFFSYPVRYRTEEGDLVEIDPELKAITEQKTSTGRSLTGYSYENTEGQYKHYLPDSISPDTPLIMENGEYVITMAPYENNSTISSGIATMSNTADSEASLQTEAIETAAAQIEEKDIKVVYGDETKSSYLEYVSINEGVKENIVLNSKPSSNVINFVISLEGMTYRMNPTDNGITLYDEETGEIIAGIDAPFMNDATGEAYSEDASYTMSRIGESNQYILTLTVSEEYLNDANRVYPVTIDPTVTWLGSSVVWDAYVISGYPTTNFYSSGVKKMVTGKGTDGIHRTYIHFSQLRAEVLNYEVTSATFDVYETGNAASGRKVDIYRISNDWSCSNITWNNKPSHSTLIDSLTITNKVYNKCTFDVTPFLQGLADGAINYGLMLKSNVESSVSYTEFFGSRTTSTAYRPKMTVTYRDLPSTATTVTASKSLYKKNESISISWSGITCYDLAKIQYRVAKADENWTITNETYVAYTDASVAASSGTITIPNSANFEEGNYRIYIRGISALGTVGTGKGCNVTIDKTSPDITLSTVVESENTIVTWSSTAEDCEGITLYLDDEELTTAYGTGGTIRIDYTGLNVLQKYKLTAKTFDKAGNHSAIKQTYFTVPYPDNMPPSIDDTTLTMDGNVIDEETWYPEAAGNVVVSYGAISDEMSGVNLDSIQCKVYKNSVDSQPIATLTSSTPTLSNNSYSGSFTTTIGSEYSDSATYIFRIEATDNNGNMGYKEVLFNKDVDLPTGAVTLTNPLSSTDLAQVCTNTQINVNASDEHSGVLRHTLQLYSGTQTELGQQVALLTNRTSQSSSFTYDFSKHSPGNYTLKLTVTDNAGHISEIYKDIVIYDEIPAPEVNIREGEGCIIQVDWKLDADIQYSSLQYSLNNGTTWTSIDIGTETSGTFSIQYDEQTSKTESLTIRGVNLQGVAGEVATSDFGVDFKLPQVAITQFEQGILRGTCYDDNLRAWAVQVKGRGGDDSSYATVAFGRNNVQDNIISIVDLSGDVYANNAWFTVRLVAVDANANISYVTTDIKKDDGYSCVTVANTQNKINRSNNIFKLNSDSSLTDVKWYVNNVKVSEEKEYTVDFTAFEDGELLHVAAFAKDADSNVYLSNKVYKNAAVITSSNNGTFTLPDNTVSFTLNAPTEVTVDGISYGVTYSATDGDVAYEVVPGAEVYFADIYNDKLCSNTVNISYSVESQSGSVTIEPFTVEANILQPEYFTENEANDYYIGEITASHKVNGKTYLTWQGADVLPENVYYQVFKGTTEDFVPDLDNVYSDNIKTNYWCDISLDYENNSYYRIRTVVKGSDGNVLSSSRLSNVASIGKSTVINLFKRIGTVDNLSYANVATPVGNGSIEKSEGNFMYEQTDFELSVGQIPLVFTRTYNSNSDIGSAIGKGWTHSYDLEIFSIQNHENVAEDNLIFKNVDGAQLMFANSKDTKENGNVLIYTSDLKRGATIEKYLNEKEDGIKYIYDGKDGYKYNFDGCGKLKYISDENGNKVSVEYDNATGLLSKITATDGTYIEITSYAEADAAYIDEILLPDGQRVKYQYTDGYLTGTTKYPSSGNTFITFSYGYNASYKLTTLTDGMNNVYTVSYATSDLGKATKFSYPAANGVVESISVDYGSATDGQSVTYKKAASAVVKTERDTFDANGQCIKYEVNPDSDSYAVEYTYDGNLVTSKIEYLTYDILDLNAARDSGTVIKKNFRRITSYVYKNELLTEESIVHVDYNNISDPVLVADYGYTESHLYLPTSYSETADGEEIVETTYEYDEAGNIVEIRDEISETGNTYIYGTDSETGEKGVIIEETQYLTEKGSEEELSSTTYSNSYADGHRTETTETNENGKSIVNVNVYDNCGRILSSMQSTSSTTDPDKLDYTETTTYTYDGFGRVKTITVVQKFSGRDPVTKTETKSYNANGTLASETDNSGITKTYTYDALSRLVSTTESAGNLSRITTNTYSYGNVSVNEGKDSQKQYVNALITTEKVDGQEVSKTYQDGRGRVVREILNGVTTDYSYDNEENKVTEVILSNAGGNKVTYHVLDDNGNETATIKNPAYDAVNGNYTVTDASIVTENTYDVSGNVLTSTDGEGNKTEYRYDAQGRITIVIPPEIGGTKFNYYNIIQNDGVVRNMVVATDGNGNKSREITDSDGNVVLTSDVGDGIVTSIDKYYDYDVNGNLLQETNTDGSFIFYNYDSANRLVQKRQFDTYRNVVYSTEYTYYENDLVKEMKDYRGSSLYNYVYYSYDAFGRLQTVCEADHILAESERSEYAITYTYDSQDNPIQISYGSAMGTEVDAVKYVYTDNHLSELKVVIGSEEYTAKKYTYSTDGSVSTVKDYYDFQSSDEHILLTYTYDLFGRIVDMSYTDDSEVIESHAYTYDKTDKIATERNVNSYTQADELRSYTYDGNGQLYMFGISGTTEYSAMYTYDRVGNRIGKDSDEGEILYTYNSLNQLIEEDNLDTGEYTYYEYDENGNQVYRECWDKNICDFFSYTPAGLMEWCFGNEDMQDNLYNGEGKRVVKTEGGEDTRYYYQEGSVLRTTDDDGNAMSFNLLNVSDTFATSRESILGEDYYFYTEDIRGSKVNVIDSDAAQVASYWYTDFGEVTEIKSASYDDFENEIQYTGAIYDKLTRLLYLNARYYDPSNGRFITQDSYRGERTKPDTWHLYLYCANDPINYVDPTGHFVVKRWMISVPIDVLCTMFGFSLGMLSNVKEIKRVLVFTGKVIKNKTNKMNESLKLLRNFAKKYDKLMRKAGTSTVQFLAKRYLGVELKKVKNGALKFATIITDNIKGFVYSTTAGKLMEKIYKYSNIFTSIGNFVAGILDIANDKKYNNILYKI